MLLRLSVLLLLVLLRAPGLEAEDAPPVAGNASPAPTAPPASAGASPAAAEKFAGAESTTADAPSAESPEALYAAALASPPLAVGDLEEDWQLLCMGKNRIGHVCVSQGTLERDGRKVIVCQSVSVMTIKRFGVELRMLISTATEEDDQGRLLGFRTMTLNPPISRIMSHGRVEHGQIVVETESAGNRKTTTLTLDDDVRSPLWVERHLEENPLAAGETRQFRVFDVEFSKVSDVTVRADGEGDCELLDGTVRKAKRHVMTHSLVPGLTIVSFSDDSGAMLRTDMGLLDLVAYASTREEALSGVTAADLDLGFNMVATTPPIPKVHESSRGVFRVTVDGAREAFASGGTQSITPISDSVVEVTVTALRPGSPAGPTPGDNSGPAPLSEPGAEYTSASRFLETDDPQVRRLAEEGAAGETDPVKLAVALEKFVHATITDKNFSTSSATAAEVARERSGDCTEHAVLLAALLRVHEIPSRVVVGFVYADSIKGFGGHMWTEAWIEGRWTPLDGTLGRGGIGVGHLKVVDSDLSENAPTPVTSFIKLIPLLKGMQVEVVTVE